MPLDGGTYTSSDPLARAKAMAGMVAEVRRRKRGAPSFGAKKSGAGRKRATGPQMVVGRKRTGGKAAQRNALAKAFNHMATHGGGVAPPQQHPQIISGPTKRRK